MSARNCFALLLSLGFILSATANDSVWVVDAAPLAASVQAALHEGVADTRPIGSSFKSPVEAVDWISEMSERLKKKIPDLQYRIDFLRTVHYEATRAGLNPELVLSLIDVESNFRKYYVSPSGARGYMQVMPYWIELIGRPEDSLFDLRTNLRYGCTMLRHYLDIEKGDLFRALGHYKGHVGDDAFPNLVRSAWQSRWAYEKQKTTTVTQSEVVFVKYRGPVSLATFSCETISRSSLVDRICFDAKQEYAVVSLKGTYYHYCEIPARIIASWKNSDSMGRYYNSYIKGSYDCRTNRIPEY